MKKNIYAVKKSQEKRLKVLMINEDNLQVNIGGKNEKT